MWKKSKPIKRRAAARRWILFRHIFFLLLSYFVSFNLKKDYDVTPIHVDVNIVADESVMTDGIIDIKNLYGVANVKETQGIDLVIHLEDWSKDKEYDRLGLEEEYTEYLGNKIVCHNIPVRPGRNLAVICESAAINHRQKKMGYNAAQELYKRVQENLAKGRR